MTEPDMALVRRFLAARGGERQFVHVGITGAHLYGFVSPDSDIDMKGMHVQPTLDLVGLSRPKEVWNAIELFEGVECDVTTREAGPALHSLLDGDGNTFERILSPYQAFASPAFEALQDIARRSVHRGLAAHYRGYFRGMRREHALKGRVKTALYGYRVALSGLHLLSTGEVNPHLPDLVSAHGLDWVRELIARKVEGAEKMPIEPSDNARVLADWDRLEAALADGLAETSLPEACLTRSELADWLRTLRLAHV